LRSRRFSSTSSGPSPRGAEAIPYPGRNLPYETRAPIDDSATSTRSETLNSIVSITQAAGGAAAGAYIAKQAIKTAGEVIVAKINAGVEKAKHDDSGHSTEPGTHDEFG